MQNENKDIIISSGITEKEKKSFLFKDSNLPLEQRIDDLLSRLTLDEKIGLIPTRQAAVERLGIKAYSVGGEAAHGLVARTGNATVFPQPIGLSSTWDPDLMLEIGSVIGDEARVYYRKNEEKGGLNLWAPTIDMERDPRWGRTEEAYGEDPYLTGRMSAALIKGMQGNHPLYLKMAAAPKHFYANNNEKDRIWGNSSVDPRNKHEYYLKAYKPAFTEGRAYSMMTAYNCINGIPAIVNPEVQKVVKDEWGMDGFVVCDGADMSQTVEHHRYYETHAETVAGALKNGVDCLTDNAELVVTAAKEAVERGLLSEAELDKAVRNILKVRFKLGQFDGDDRNPYASIPEAVLCSEKHSKLSLKAAQEAIVLLKNDNNTLPLDGSKLKRVAVIGPLADVVYRDWYTGTPPYKVTPLQGIRSKLKGKDIAYVEGCDQITLKSLVNNRYIYPQDSEEASLMANKGDAGASQVFDMTDWGWGNYTLKAHANGKYVTTRDNGTVAASAEEVWGWFVKELYGFVPQEDGTFAIKTWNNKYVSVPTGRCTHLAVSNLNVTDDSEKFTKTVVADGIAEAVKAAEQSDAAIVFVGNHPLVNGKEEIDRLDITLPPAQEKLIQEVYKANKNTIVVIIGSYPYAINWEDEHIPAILYSAHGSQELGNAVADVLFGDYSPAGRLSMTWYRSVDQLPDIKDYDIIKGKRTYMYFDGQTLYPFGYGLTYTDFEYGNLQLSSRTIGEKGEIDISLDVTNIGSAASDEVIQLYVNAKESRVKRPFKELKGFKRVHLMPGQSKTVSFTLPAGELAFWDVTRDKFCMESGIYEIMVGSSSEDIRLRDTFDVAGEKIPPRNLVSVTRAENYDDYHGVLLDECSEGGACVSYTDEGDWIAFHDVEFGDGVNSFEARAATDSSGYSIEIRLDSPQGILIGTCAITFTGGWQSWETYSCSIKGAAGRHDVYLKFTGAINLSWFKFIV